MRPAAPCGAIVIEDQSTKPRELSGGHPPLKAPSWLSCWDTEVMNCPKSIEGCAGLVQRREHKEQMSPKIWTRTFL